MKLYNICDIAPLDNIIYAYMFYLMIHHACNILFYVKGYVLGWGLDAYQNYKCFLLQGTL